MFDEMSLWFIRSQWHLNYLAAQPFDYERTWWRLFQKRVVRTKFDIYVLITITWSIYVIINKTKDLLPQT